MEWKKMPRRRLLKILLLGGGGLLVVKTLPSGWSKDEYLCLSSWNRDPLHKLATVILSSTDTGMPKPEKADVYKRLDEELYFSDKAIQSDFRDALTLVEWYPFSMGKISRFSRLSDATALEVIQKGLRSSNDLVRAAFSNLRMVIFLIYYGHSSTWEKIGYDGPFGAMPQKLSEQRKYYRTQTGG